jgi:altronate dehydratase
MGAIAVMFCYGRKLDFIIRKLEVIMATLDELLDKVTEEATVDESMLELLAGLKQQLADALSGANLPPAVQAKVDAVFSKASENVTKINEALAANTP